MTSIPSQQTLHDALSSDVVKKVIAEFGLTESTPEKQAEILDKIGELVFKRVLLDILKQLPAKALRDYDVLIESGTQEDWQKFLGENFGDPDRFIENSAREEIQALKDEIERESREPEYV